MKAALQYCPSCKTELPDNARFCRHCGLVLSATTTIDGAREKRRSPPVDDIEQQDSRVVRSHLAAGNKRRSLYHKVLGKLPLPVQHAIAAVLARAGDPEPEVPHTGDQKAAGSPAIAWGWLPILTLTSALAMLPVAYAYTSSRSGTAGAATFFWLGVLLMFVPPVVRLISPAASRFERMNLLCVVGACFYLVDVVARPFAFSGHDAFVHSRTADDIFRSGHLFSENPLLPASPFYPGLEIVTNALSRLSGLNTFTAGTIVVGVARLVMILSLFILYERITKSARAAGIATILYMANPHFLFFDAQYSYESLALPLATLVLFATARHDELSSDRRWIMLAALIPLGAVVVTHHVTSFVFDGLFLLWAVMYAFQRPARLRQANVAAIALFGILTSLAWIVLIKGNPVVDYLSSYFGNALNELGHILAG